MATGRELKSGLESFGYDTFIGREVFEDGKEFVVTLDLHGGGSISYTTLFQACKDLSEAVRTGKAVLLSRSPGAGLPVHGVSGDALDIRVKNLISGIVATARAHGDIAMVQEKTPDGQPYTIAGRTYLPFKPDQMASLRKMYEQESMKSFPNPFEQQPR